jgi:hypothetical protein
MRILHRFFLLAIFSSYAVSAEPMWVVETCKIKKWADGKWETVDASEFKGTELDVSPNSKKPEFFQFKLEGRIYSAKKACFTSEPGGGGGSPGSSVNKDDSRMIIFAGVGITASPKDRHELTILDSTTSVEGTVASALTFGLEGRKKFSSNFFASGSLEYVSYKSTAIQDGNSIMSLVLMPGISFGSTLKIWAGMGAGVSMISVKGISETDAVTAITVDLPDTSLFALILSPRIGLGVDVSNNSILELMLAYNMIGTAKWSGAASAGATSVDATDSFKISYLSAVLRIGQRF